jgi:hypothetical protein
MYQCKDNFVGVRAIYYKRQPSIKGAASCCRKSDAYWLVQHQLLLHTQVLCSVVVSAGSCVLLKWFLVHHQLNCGFHFVHSAGVNLLVGTVAVEPLAVCLEAGVGIITGMIVKVCQNEKYSCCHCCRNRQSGFRLQIRVRATNATQTIQTRHWLPP